MASAAWINRKLVALLTAQLLLPCLCHAHNVGPLDSRGCHEDRRRGTYHCHTEEYAGLTFNSVADLERQVRAGVTAEQMRKAQGKETADEADDEKEGGWLSKIPFFGSRRSSEHFRA